VLKEKRDEAAALLAKAKAIHAKRNNQMNGAYKAIWAAVGIDGNHATGDFACNCFKAARSSTNKSGKRGHRPITDEDWVMAIEMTKTLSS
jgi:hypothetical protein